MRFGLSGMKNFPINGEMKSTPRAVVSFEKDRFQVSAGKFRNCEFRDLGIEGILSF